MHNRENRKRKILDIVLKKHIEAGTPVGSKYISDIMGVSSATIRNIMGDLETDGYLVQPYTSAGRIPTERAYRLYVNSLIDEEVRNLKEIEKLREDLFAKYRSYHDLIERASYAISNLTNCTSFVIYPEDHLYLDGIHFILDNPEFKSLGEVKKIVKALDEKEQMLSMVNHYLREGCLKIHIGRENLKNEFSECSIITASYVAKNKVVGGLGIIGPVRMKYKKIVPVIKYIADSFSRMLDSAI